MPHSGSGLRLQSTAGGPGSWLVEVVIRTDDVAGCKVGCDVSAMGDEGKRPPEGERTNQSGSCSLHSKSCSLHDGPAVNGWVCLESELARRLHEWVRLIVSFHVQESPWSCCSPMRSRSCSRR